MLMVASTLVARRTSAQSSTTVTAQSIQRWSIANNNHLLATLSDGTLVATGNGASVRLNPNDGSVVGPVTAPDMRFAVLPADAGANRPDYLIGGYQDKHAYKGNGDEQAAWDWILLGCCNIGRIPMAVDPVTKRAYESSHDVVFVLDALTGQEVARVSSGQLGGGYTSVADADTVYVAGGPVGRVTLSTGEHWNIAPPGMESMQPGAVTTDGGIAVSGGIGSARGRLAVLRPSGALAWNLDVNAVTPPVIGGGGLVFVGTQEVLDENGPGAIEAYDPSDGRKVWSTPVEGVPGDLLVGDDGAIYAGTGSFTRGRVYALDQATGELRRTITNVPGAQGIILSGGLLFASGEAITALPVEALNYDPASPWPVRFHDNLRTASRTTQHLNPPRQPAPTPQPTPQPTPPFQINIDPGSYTGHYTIQGFNQDRPSTLTLMPGRYVFDNQAAGRFTFDVDASGQMVNISSPASAHASGNTLVLHNAEIIVDPQNYTGNYFPYSHVNLPPYRGVNTITLIPNLNWALSIGDYHNAFNFFLDAGGEVRDISNPAAATSTGNRITLNNTTVIVDPQNYTGTYIPVTHFNLANVHGVNSFVLVPGMRYYLVIGDFFTGFSFTLDASGQIESVDNPAAGHGAGSTLILHNALVAFDPQAYAGYFYPHTHSFIDFRGGARIVLVPNLRYPLAVGAIHSLFFFTLGEQGQLVSVDNPAAAFIRDNTLVLKNACVNINPGGFAGSYEIILVGIGHGEQTFTFVPTMQYYFRDSANQAQAFVVAADGQTTPPTLPINLNGQNYNFALTPIACDQSPPVTSTQLSQQPNASGWNNADVTLTLTATDGDDGGGTGVKEIHYSVNGTSYVAAASTASFTVSTEGANTVTYFATDNAGNAEAPQTFAIKLDKTSPSVSCGSADGLWHAGDVLIPCTASDGNSSLMSASDAAFSLSTSVAAGTENSNASTNNRVVCDVAGNCATAGAIGGNKVDKQAPTITITAPSNGIFLLNQIMPAQFSCTDNGSGLQTCVGSVANGSNLDTSSTGAKTFTVTATDQVGNIALPQSVSYSVGFGIGVLFDQTKAVKSGSAITIKVQLIDALGRNISSAGVIVHAVSLIRVSTNASETINDAGNSNGDDNFRYEPTLGSGGGYIFNLKTTGLRTGSYLLGFTAGNDPAVHTVQFQVRQ
jgi:hypothetical protein